MQQVEKMNLEFQQEGHVGILKINRPKALNALNKEVLCELRNFLLQPPSIRALILTGEGEKAFIAGADIVSMQSMTPPEMYEFCNLGQEVTQLLEQAPFIVIAAVNGYALGGGLEMALACDFIYASSQAKLGLPEVSLGLIPGFGGTQRLARAVGPRRAKEIMMTGRPLNADEALSIGLVNRICEPEQLLSDCRETLSYVLKNSFSAVQKAKRAVECGVEMGMDEALELEKNLCALCFSHADQKEGMTAFVEKRKPQFQ